MKRFLVATKLASFFRFSVAMVAVWGILLTGIGAAHAQVKLSYRQGPPPPNSQPPENLYNQFYQLPFPVADTHAVWVMDDHSQPIAGATVEWMNAQKVSQSVSTDAQGLANLEALPVGWTKLVISRTGYLSQNKWVNLVPGRKLKEKVALGKPGDYMFPGAFHLFPVHNPKFRVGLSHRVDHQVPPQVLGTDEQREAEFNGFKELLPDSLRPFVFSNVFPLPQDVSSQKEVLEKIRNSHYWEVGRIIAINGTAGDRWITNCGWMYPRVEIFIPRHHITESEIVQIVRQHGFEVKTLVDTERGGEFRWWILNIVYRGDSGPEFLYACSKLHQALPNYSFEIQQLSCDKIY